jgi:DNA-binding beta-propeller fold protein YncE
MRKKLLFLLFICLVSVNLLNAQNLLVQPQKIVIDNDHNRLLVSNFGDGSIVEIDEDGNLTYFAQNTDCTDGMEISFPTGTSVYLSSIASDSAGYLFISCPALHTIYRFRISDQSFWVLATGGSLNRPNGILLETENDRIVVIDDSQNTSTIHAISLSV